MLKIECNEYNLKFNEINFRQRNYQDKNIVTIMGISEILPRMYNEQIISGSIEFSFDSDKLNNLKDLENKKYTKDVKLTVSLSINGKWEINTYYDGMIEFDKIKDNNIFYKLSSNKGNVSLECEAIMISLYTTSTSKEKLNKCFNMDDFYNIPISKKIGNNEVLKYFIKN